MMNSALQPAGVFYLLGTFGLISVFFTAGFMKESKGLTEKEKKSLYAPTQEVCFVESELEKQSEYASAIEVSTSGDYE